MFSERDRKQTRRFSVQISDEKTTHEIIARRLGRSVDRQAVWDFAEPCPSDAGWTRLRALGEHKRCGVWSIFDNGERHANRPKASRRECLPIGVFIVDMETMTLRSEFHAWNPTERIHSVSVCFVFKQTHPRRIATKNSHVTKRMAFVHGETGFGDAMASTADTPETSPIPHRRCSMVGPWMGEWHSFRVDG